MCFYVELFLDTFWVVELFGHVVIFVLFCCCLFCQGVIPRASCMSCTVLHFWFCVPLWRIRLSYKHLHHFLYLNESVYQQCRRIPVFSHPHWHFWFQLFSACEEIAYGFEFSVPWWLMIEYLYMCLLVIYFSSLEKCLFKYKFFICNIYIFFLFPVNPLQILSLGSVLVKVLLTNRAYICIHTHTYLCVYVYIKEIY